MAGPDFYEILGVIRTASLDEIKSAHREQVKKYHPDLFPSPNQKARANKRLQQINEAYTVLSNPERRRQYDSRFFQNAKIVKPPTAASKSRSTATFRRPSGATIWKNLARQAAEKIDRMIHAYRSLSRAAGNHYRNLLREARNARQQAAAAPKSATFRQSGSIAAITRNFARRWTRWVSIKAIGGILGIIVLILVFQAVGKEPEIITAWTLLESEVVEPSRNAFESKAGERNWQALGHHDSKAQCAESLKQRVALDERRGSKVFLDDRSGLIAMTIYGKTEAALAEELLRERLKQENLSGADPQFLEQQARDEARAFVKKNGPMQQVKQYQCRETQLVKTESWLRSKLRQLGLIS